MPGFEFDWGKVFEGFQSAPDRLIGELGPWMRSLVMAASAKWLPRLIMAQDPCAVPRTLRSSEPCGAPAVALCRTCRRPACIWHGAMDAHGNIFCFVCVGELVAKDAASSGWARPERPQVRADPNLDAAYALLGVRPAATDSELASAYKLLLTKWHPDRYQSQAKKEIAEARFKAVRAAYDLIQKQRGSEAA
jgi:hypothetical protein